ncbi:efflux transporter outer membrane subunit [Marivirga lumbricoides]
MKIKSLRSLLFNISQRKYFLKGSFNFLCLTIALFVWSCATKTVQSDLPFETPETFSHSGTMELPEKWWLSFEDSTLNEIVRQALDSNLNLITALKRYEAAQAVVDRESSSLFPQVSGFVQSAFSRPEPDFVGGENVQFGLRASYEVDLWGRIRAQIDAEEYRATAAYNDMKAAAISLSAEITTIWYRLEAAAVQLQILQQQAETNQKILKLIRARFGSGQIRAVDILRQQQLVESTLQQQYAVETLLALLKNQLAVLLGETPQNIQEPELDSLPSLPPLPQTGIPAELITRRPDVQASFSALKAADRELAAAISNQYPRLTLNTNLSFRSNNFQNLFDNYAYSLAGNLLAPIFYGGQLSAEVDRTEAVKDQRFYEYGQTVLVAFREVEDALVQENKQKEIIEALTQQVKLADKVSRQLRVEYFNGLSDYLAVLTALNQEQQLRRDLITARLNLLEFRISLYRALAGGFEIRGETEEEPVN